MCCCCSIRCCYCCNSRCCDFCCRSVGVVTVADFVVVFVTVVGVATGVVAAGFVDFIVLAVGADIATIGSVNVVLVGVASVLVFIAVGVVSIAVGVIFVAAVVGTDFRLRWCGIACVHLATNVVADTTAGILEASLVFFDAF